MPRVSFRLLVTSIITRPCFISPPSCLVDRSSLYTRYARPAPFPFFILSPRLTPYCTFRNICCTSTPVDRHSCIKGLVFATTMYHLKPVLEIFCVLSSVPSDSALSSSQISDQRCEYKQSAQWIQSPIVVIKKQWGIVTFRRQIE